MSIRLDEYNLEDTLSQSLLEMKEKRELIDCVLVMDCEPKIKIYAHRVVLASASPYFQEKFSHHCKKDNETGLYVVRIASRVDMGAVDEVINAIYIQKLRISEQTALNLLMVAKLFEHQPVIYACTDFLIKGITPYKVFDMIRLSELHGFYDLRDMAIQFALQHFKKAIENKCSFYQLSVEQLVTLLAHDDLNVAEEVVLQKACEWMDHDPDRRNRHAGSILNCVRFELLPIELLQKIRAESVLVRDYPLCKNNLIDAWCLIASGQLPTNLRIYQLQQSQQKLILLGGKATQRHEGKLLSTIQNYALTASSLTTCCAYEQTVDNLEFELPEPLWKFGAILLDNSLYIIGGNLNCRRDQPSNATYIYDFNSKSWCKGPSMEEARQAHAVAILNGVIYAIGGKDRSSCEVLSCRDGWCLNKCASLCRNRYDFGVAVIESMLYVIGGMVEKTCGAHEPHCSFLCYDGATRKWNNLANLSQSRASHATCVIEGKIAIAGGESLSNSSTYVTLNSVEIYDPTTDQWQKIANLAKPRLSACMVNFHDTLYLIGGADSKHGDRPKFVTSVERYDSETGQWTVLATKIQEPIVHGSAIVLKKQQLNLGDESA